jgi:hypothetical protein
MKLMKLFKRKLKKRDMYAVTAGKYLGDFIVFEDNKSTKGTYPIIVLPDLVSQKLDEKIVQEGFDKGILDFVKRLPSAVYIEIIKQIDIKQKKTQKELKEATDEFDNRREQLVTSSVLGKQE